MFYDDDYPDWIDDLFNDLNLDDSQMQQEVWGIARQYEEVPHIGNIQFEWLAEQIVEYIKENIKPDIEYTIYPNCQASYIYINGVVIKDISDIEDIDGE